MSTLDYCLTSLKLTDRADIMSDVNDYVRRGLSKEEASLRAVEDKLLEAKAQQGEIKQAVLTAFRTQNPAAYDAAQERKKPPPEAVMASIPSDQTQTEAFKRWFGNSVVTDNGKPVSEGGKPLVVYHGTDQDFDAFSQASRGQATGAKSARQGFFFTARPDAAVSYANYAAMDGRVKRLMDEADVAEKSGNWDRQEATIDRAETLERAIAKEPRRGQNVIPAFLSIQNPAVMDAQGEMYSYISSDIENFIAQAKRDGKDGVIIRNLDDAAGLSDRVGDHYMLFEPAQIKSAVGNNGQFDSKNPRITASIRAHSGSSTTSQIRDALVNVFGQEGIDALIESGILSITTSDAAPDGSPSAAEAVYHNGRAYLFADRMDVNRAEAVLLHELGEHFGLQTMLGPRGWKSMKLRIAELAKQEGSYTQGAWDAVQAGYKQFDGMADAQLAQNDEFIHEVIAKVGETAVGRNTTLWQDILSAIKRFMAHWGLTKPLTEDDVALLVRTSLERVMRQAKRGQQATLAQEAAMASMEAAKPVDAAQMLQMIAQSDEAFQYPISGAQDLPDIFAEIDPQIRLRHAPALATEKGVDDMWIIMDKNTSMNVPAAQVYERGDKVWIDVFKFKETVDGGAKVYAAVANYAYNNGLVFIGDPAGLSPTAFFRRTEHMLSSALKFGTTRHIAPHEAQLNPKKYFTEWQTDDALRIAREAEPLRWVQEKTTEDYQKNLHALMDAVYQNVVSRNPDAAGIRYNFNTQEFEDADGRNVSAAELQERAEQARTSSERARGGGSTLKRAAFIHTLLREESAEGGGRALGAYGAELQRSLPDSLNGLFYSLTVAEKTQQEIAVRRMERFVQAYDRSELKPEFTQTLGDTPAVLQALGADALPLHIKGDTVLKVLGGKHKGEVGTSHLVDAVAALYDPALVFQSNMSADGKIAVSENLDAYGRPVTTVVHLRKQAGRMIVNDIASVYGAAASQMQDWASKGLLLYAKNPSATPTATPWVDSVVQAAKDSGVDFITQNELSRTMASIPLDVDSFRRKIENPKQWLDPMANKVGAALRGRETFGALDKSVHTQLHKASKNPYFKRVFNGVMGFMTDASRFALRPAKLAPNVLPAMDVADGLGPALKTLWQGKAAQADIDAAFSAITRGTLAGESVLEGVRYGTAQEAGLTDAQFAMYQEFRAAIDASLDEAAASEAFRAFRQFAKRPVAPQQVIVNEAGKPWATYFAASQERAARGLQKTHEIVESDDGFFLRSLMPEKLLEANESISTALMRSLDSVQNSIAEAPSSAKQVLLAELNAALASTTEEPARAAIQSQIDTVTGIFDHNAALQSAGYAPLTRFGQYFLDAVRVNPDGSTAQREFFGLYETEGQRDAALAQLQTQYTGENVQFSAGTKAMDDFKQYQGVSPETVELFARAAGIPIDEAMQEHLRKAVNNRSTLKRMIHRQGIAGFSTDGSRVLASFLTSNGRRAAQNIHAVGIQEALEPKAWPKEQGAERDDARKLAEYVQNPDEEAAGFKALMFFHFLGGSVSNFFLNITQPAMVTLPYLAKTVGAKKASQFLAQGYKTYRNLTKNPSAVPQDLRDAIARAEESGDVGNQEINHLWNESARPLINRLGGENAQARMQAFMQIWGAPFAMSEQINRRASFAAAYLAAKDAGNPDPYAAAIQAVRETMFVYNKAGRPNWARGTLGAAAFTFKTFSISYVELLVRLLREGPEGRKAALIMLGMLWFASGLNGLPGGDDLDDVIDTFMQLSGHNWSNKFEKRKVLENLAGSEFADFMLNGVSVFTPLDLQGRMGLGNLLPATGFLKPSETDKFASLLELIGPAGGLAKSYAQASEAGVNKGMSDALAEALPKALRDLKQGGTMLLTGEHIDTRGRKVADVGVGGAIAKAVGFQPNDVALASREMRELMPLITLAKKTQTRASELWAQGRAQNDPEKIQQAKELVQEWNATNPDTPIEVSMAGILRRAQQMRTTKAERFTQTAPKGLRAMVKAELPRQEATE